MGYQMPQFDVQSVCGDHYWNPLDPSNFCDCAGDAQFL